MASERELLTIRKYVLKYFVEYFNDIYKYQYSWTERDHVNEVGSCLRCQYYIDDQFKKIYLQYELDWKSKYKFDRDQMYLRINTKFLNDFFRDTTFRVDILGIATNWPFYKDLRDSQQVYDSLHLTKDTITYWMGLDKHYHFINDMEINRYRTMPYFMQNTNVYGIRNGLLDLGDFHQFIRDIAEVSNTYKDDIPQAFELYKEYYKNLYGYELKKIEDSEIHKLIIDINTND